MSQVLAAEGGYQNFTLGDSEWFWLYFCIAVALIALVAGWAMMRSVLSKEAGTDKMNEIAAAVQEGAMAYIKRQFRTILIIVVPLAAIVFVTSTEILNPLDTAQGLDRLQSGLFRTLAFLAGALFSGFIGFLGMWLATRANVRTAAAAKTGSMDAALQVAFRAGGTIGLFTAGLGLLGATLIVMIFQNTASAILVGFGFGGSLLALFLRVGGGIFTKAADVGADLVGKVEAGIPEDDPRNPATIADNVGDNVGDVAGMGADLFGSYVATMLATMVLGREVVSADNFGGMAPILLPMVIAGLGVLFSIVGTFFVRINKDSDSVMAALNKGNWGSMILVAITSYPLVQWMLPETMQFVRNGISTEITSMNVFWAIMLGLVVGTLMSMVTEYYTSMGRRPVLSIVKKSGTGHGTNVIGGLAMGMESTVLPILLLAAGIWGSFALAGMYGVAIAAAGMMATTAMQLAIDAFGPIADNAGGIAEMSGLPKEVRERTDNLDAVGNTTAATGKGFAIASAALTALALFAAYVGMSGISGIDIYKADVLAMLFVGGMIPFFFSSLAISAVGKAAMDMVKEVRRQFREIPGIMEGKAKPEYEKCVAISTKASIREMIAPGALALLAPILVGFLAGPEALGGLLAGITVSGVLMGMFQNNAGGAWDNAKKSFEKGVDIDGVMYYKHKADKPSAPHQAAVTGDTVGDPFKDTSGPSMNILIKLTSIVALIIAPHINENAGAPAQVEHGVQIQTIETVDATATTPEAAAH